MPTGNSSASGEQLNNLVGDWNLNASDDNSITRSLRITAKRATTDRPSNLTERNLAKASETFFDRMQSNRAVTIKVLREVERNLAKKWLFVPKLNSHSRREDAINHIQLIWIKYILGTLEFIPNRTGIQRVRTARSTLVRAITAVMNQLREDATKNNGVVTDAAYNEMTGTVAIHVSEALEGIENHLRQTSH